MLGQLVPTLIGWWQGNRAVFWELHHQSLVPTGLGSSVDFLYLVGVLVSTKQLKDMTQDIIYSPWREIGDPWLYYYFVLLECFPLFLHFLISQIKFDLWKSAEGIGDFSFCENMRQGTWESAPGKAPQGPAWFQFCDAECGSQEGAWCCHSLFSGGQCFYNGSQQNQRCFCFSPLLEK